MSVSRAPPAAGAWLPADTTSAPEPVVIVSGPVVARTLNTSCPAPV